MPSNAVNFTVYRKLTYRMIKGKWLNKDMFLLKSKFRQVKCKIICTIKKRELNRELDTVKITSVNILISISNSLNLINLL